MNHCPICAAKREEGHVFLLGNWGVRTCGKCGHGWTDPTPTDEQLREVYGSSNYYSRRGMAARSVRHGDRARVRWLASRFGVGRLLDVGCGAGLLLAAASEEGFDVAGTEVSEEGAEAVRNRFGVPVRSGEFGDDQFGPDELFDLITMFHVLEHLRDPTEALRVAGRLLAPGGSIFVEVPHREAMVTWFPGPGRRKNYDLPVHLHHFTPGSMSRVVEDAGLRTDEVFVTLPRPVQRALWVAEGLWRLFRGGGRDSEDGNASPVEPEIAIDPPDPEGDVDDMALAGPGSRFVDWTRRTAPGYRFSVILSVPESG